jgi:hypothetical protein
MRRFAAPEVKSATIESLRFDFCFHGLSPEHGASDALLSIGMSTFLVAFHH